MNSRESVRNAIFRQPLVAPAAIVFVIVILAAVNWALSPEEAGRWLTAMLALPVIWLVLLLWYLKVLRSQRLRGIEDESGTRHYFRSAVCLTIVAIGIRQIAVFGLRIWVELGNGSVDLEVERRILGLATSAVFIVAGNALPKILTPFSMLTPGQAALVTIARRFIGSCWFVLGAVMAVAFLLAPLAFAATLQRWGAIAALLIMFGGIVWMNLAPEKPTA